MTVTPPVSHLVSKSSCGTGEARRYTLRLPSSSATQHSSGAEGHQLTAVAGPGNASLWEGLVQVFAKLLCFQHGLISKVLWMNTSVTHLTSGSPILLPFQPQRNPSGTSLKDGLPYAARTNHWGEEGDNIRCSNKIATTDEVLLHKQEYTVSQQLNSFLCLNFVNTQDKLEVF